MTTTLVFVYNADSGFANAMVDVAHKLFSPGTYACNLCQLTHSAFGMRDRWRDFLESLNYEMEFLHRDEFRVEGHALAVELPAILRRSNEEMNVLIAAEELNAIVSLEDLMAVLGKKLKGPPSSLDSQG